ncbi:unnamed protein product [Somion occarium]|uniref:Uncharacterized protein n=1 Tax=Somion occarium TaxID=3059160 RepID=A0ABP1DM75_9APHY
MGHAVPRTPTQDKTWEPTDYPEAGTFVYTASSLNVPHPLEWKTIRPKLRHMSEPTQSEGDMKPSSSKTDIVEASSSTLQFGEGSQDVSQNTVRLAPQEMIPVGVYGQDKERLPREKTHVKGRGQDHISEAQKAPVAFEIRKRRRVQNDSVTEPPPKRKRGRPPGSKNKRVANPESTQQLGDQGRPDVKMVGIMVKSTRSGPATS